MEVISEEELQRWVNRVSKTYFNKPVAHAVRYNKRLKTTAGRYLLASHALEFNPKYVAACDQKTVEGIIKHELCHYHLHLAHMPYQHRDQAFKTLLAQVGGLTYAPGGVVAPTRQKKKYHYRCLSCGQDYWRVRRVDLRKKRCGRCFGRLTRVP